MADTLENDYLYSEEETVARREAALKCSSQHLIGQTVSLG